MHIHTRTRPTWAHGTGQGTSPKLAMRIYSRQWGGGVQPAGAEAGAWAWVPRFTATHGILRGWLKELGLSAPK